MSKGVKEIIITVVLVIVLAVVVINNLKGAKKPKKATAASKPAEPAEVLSPPAAVLADTETNKETLSQQRQRAENLAWGRDPFVYVEAEPDRSYRVGALELKGVSLGKDKTGYAFINNEIVKVGDTVAGYEVLKIEKDKVLLRKGNQSFYLTLPEE